jgi:hypothetical protein
MTSTHDNESDPKYAEQADAGDTSFAGKGNAKAGSQPAATPPQAEVRLPKRPETSPQPGTGLDSEAADAADQADAGDTSFDPGKDQGKAQ